MYKALVVTIHPHGLMSQAIVTRYDYTNGMNIFDIAIPKENINRMEELA